MSYYIVFLLLLSASLCLAYLTKKGWARTIPVTNFLLIFLLYVCGLFARLDIGMYLFFALCGGLLVAVVVRLCLKKDFSFFLQTALSPAAFFYVLAGITFGVLFTKMVFWHIDELSHWALVVKNMATYDNFGNIGESTTMFNRYVPGSGIFLYAFQFFNENIVDGHFQAAFALLVLSLLLPVSELFKHKFSLGAILAPCLAMGVLIVLNTSIFSILFVDGLLGACAAYLYLAYLIDRKKTDWFTFVSLGLGAMTVTLIKTSGLALVAFSLVFILVDMLTRSRDNAKFFLKYRAWMFAIPVLLIVFAKISWNVYCDAFSVRAGWDTSEMSLPNILSYLTAPNEFQTEVTRNFFRTYFIGPFRYDMSVFLQLPNLFLYAIVGALSVALYFGTKNKVFAGVQFGTMIFILFGYGIVLLMLYVFSFTYTESLHLTCYGRYYSSVVIVTVMTLVYQCIEVFLSPLSDRRAEKVAPEKAFRVQAITLGGFVTALIALGVGLCAAFIPHIDRQVELEYGKYATWIEKTSALEQNTGVYYVMVDYVEDYDECFEYLKVRYLCTPKKCNGFTEGGSYVDGRNVKLPYTGNPFSLAMSEEDFVAETAKYDYLFIDDATEAFVAKFGKYFEETPSSQVLYRRAEANGEPQFIRAE